ncbi:hypothetical protein [Kribbella pratensis]|uniref:Uncharacterized protein n=1 Tax=Kribbella pratensis TaxID=2512112 RepID=A0A4R8CI69_9ACTN|nr:hypothetical protein [Kribbella pratensis]TDW76139.1 hypothetical protein EV653_1284 [Kribbella pratensis]
MDGNQALALLLIFAFSFAIAKNWRKVLIFLGALAMTAVCFTVYSIVAMVDSTVAPSPVAPTTSTPTTAGPGDLQAGPGERPSKTTQQR